MFYQFLFIFIFTFMIFTMKFISWMLTPEQTRRGLALTFFLKTPYISIRSLLNPTRFKAKTSAFFRLFIFPLLFFTYLFGVKTYLAPLHYWDIIVLAPTAYFLTETMSALGQVLFTRPHRNIFPLHMHPLLSRSLSQFWGRRWNLWVQDWLKDISQGIKTRSRTKRIVLIFLYSGLFHEIMFNLPYCLYFKKFFFGNMMLYFITQGLGLALHKSIVHKWHPLLQRVYLWLVVLLPSPLFMATPYLEFLELTYG